MSSNIKMHQELFFELIRVAIGTQESLSRLPSAHEWEELYQMAKMQSLVGVCFVALQMLGADADEGFTRIGISEMLYLRWMGMAATIQKKNENINLQCTMLQSQLSDHGFRSCILKGQGVAALYKCEGKDVKERIKSDFSKLRQSGDIDIWLDAPKEKVIDYVMKLFPTKVFDQKHIHFQIFEDTDVEAHWIPVKQYNPLRNNILRKYFEQERTRQFCNNENGLCIPTIDFQLTHQLLHVYNHYVYEGVGLRQIMDLYFAQLAYINCSELSKEYQKYHEMIWLFHKLGLQKFLAATQWVMNDVFGLSKSCMLCTPDEKEGRKLLDKILIGGNFGHHDERNHVKDETFMQRFFRRWGRMFRVFRYDPLGTLIMPISRLKLEFWMRSIRRKYNV